MVLQKWEKFFIIQHCIGGKGGSGEKMREILRSVPTILAGMVSSYGKVLLFLAKFYA